MANTATTATNDLDLIREAEDEIAETRYLAAGRLLRQVTDESKLEESHRECLAVADDCDSILQDLRTQTPEVEGWKKQTEKHAKFDTAIFYKVDESNKLTSRMEAAVPSSLLIGLISVLNECQLYGSWMPSWSFPRVGYRRTDVLKDMGRGHLFNHVVVDLPPPYHARDVVMHCRAIDEIDFGSKIIIRATGLQTRDDDECVPDLEKKTVRMDFDVAFVIEACPPDHPLLLNSKIQYPEGERILILRIKQCVDAKVSYVPISLINFFTRQFLHSLLVTFLSVGVEVRDGKRPDHKAAIESKPELYDWVQGRIDVMFEKIEQADTN